MIGKDLLSELKFKESYAKFDKTKLRMETWEESTESVMQMHYNKFSQLDNWNEIEPYFDKAALAYKNMEILASQRNLQFRENQISKHNVKLYNCFGVETKFVTDIGMKSFEDFEDGDEVKVLTHKGNWKNAVVKNYGKQKLNEVTFKRNKATHKFRVTSDHRWILKDNVETTNLKEGDRIIKTPNIFNEFNYDTATPFEKLYWTYGYVYGDGTRVKNNEEYKYSMVRLCDADAQYEDRFIECGFKTSSSLSIEGDIMVYTGKYLKTTPNPEIDSPELIRAFVAGYLAADGAKNNNNKYHDDLTNKYVSIQSSDLEHIKFIRDCFPIAGIHIVSEKELTGQKTNFGIRTYTISFTLTAGQGHYAPFFNVDKIVENVAEEDVWCLEVEDDHSFILEHGLPTGNCSVTYIDRPRVFAETMYVLLGGAGVGFSVESRFVNKLPKIKKRKDKIRTFIIPDSIEGWAIAVDELVNSFFKGSERIIFDYSEIRPKGTLIAGEFIAPGPDGLKQSLELIENLLQKKVDAGEERLSTLNAHDMVCMLSDAVLSGGVRRSALISLFDKDDEEMIQSKTGDWWVHSPWRARANNSVKLLKDELTKEEFDEFKQYISQFGEPGIVLVDNIDMMVNPCAEIGFIPRNPYTDNSCFQFCVAGDTKIITRNGLYDIEDLVDVETEIWNGEKWSKVKPYQTGDNDDLYRVEFSDGSYLDATNNHKFLAKNRFDKEYKEYTTLELIEELKTSKYSLNVPRANVNDFNFGVEETNAYEYGFVLGDACIGKKSKQIISDIYYGSDKEYLEMNYSVHKSDDIKKTVIFETLDLEFTKKLKYEDELPDELYNWNRESILKFIAGWADSDGSNASNGIRIYGNESKLRVAQILLTKCGINSSLNLFALKGEETNLCIRKSSVYYLQITKTIDIPCQRLICDNDLEPIKKGKNQIIKKITKLEGKHNSYCLTEDELHQCIFNNVLTKQCNLNEIIGSHSVTPEIFYEQCEAAAILGTFQASYTSFPFLGPDTEALTQYEALIGVSITGIMNNPQVLLDPETLEKGAEIVKETNKIIADLIGINQAARTTTVKPSGNACLTFNSLIKTNKGNMTLEEIFDYCSNSDFNIHLNDIQKGDSFVVESTDLQVYDENNELQDITGLYFNGLSDVYEIEFEDGIKYEFTGEHKLKTNNGWKYVSDLTEEDEIISF